MGKPIRNAYLGTVKHDWTPLFAIEPIGNLSYLFAVIFEIPKQYFIIKHHYGFPITISKPEILN